MSILTGPEIVRIVERTRAYDHCSAVPGFPLIRITPFDPNLAGPNSYDVSLGETVRVYGSDALVVPSPRGGNFLRWRRPSVEDPLDPRRPNPTCEVRIPADGLIFEPGDLYLGATIEMTHCEDLVPTIETRSSVARLGISSHLSAGFGDDNFNGRWTLEITTVYPILVFPGMRISQVAFTTLVGERKPYGGRYQHSDEPVSSRFHEDERTKG